ncbi:MAG: beta-ketoacyl-ACP synthase II [Candidatus Thiodiazotropha endolucinida]|uniref:3-oxoacyl-[acyl-carrier-protein] synthase 2 n=2 Tax=Candidatus Thiodiazotropha TaxID=1913444 RepID=A0A7Z0VJV0_9GAMM|nr:beta-ketoacyl-ACP synthase II [Candidatus Thiodiazotropha endolucinida]MBT3012895.1 beta-ketoacyl-ACP synthase II [Candidatus Thiodiazotropha sp. (ex Lucina pensylvanica)]MBT3017673.1 beta-ketoacyl-ACP synthase II [Candidatus Thiodiazotropha taylori]MBT3040399.1 beta-ketoacyl-ACP synthase II [Candidatus Thiodiazotropha sp. (ex Codakia orbicularis)]MCU7944473.1 beta-ketoacyl-ACP synthase II [Candidatus Thiodiazotropha sp. (ex Cardiolucina cf. quadrata)]PUB73567.1 MAG: beta-ketoacyl-[acyl-car
MTARRVVVTGLGMVAPVGLDIPTSWENIQAGKSGIQPITHFDVGSFSTQFGGPIYGFEITDYIAKKEAKKMDKFIHYGIAAGIQAIKDAGLEVTEENAERIGVLIGSGIGGITGIENSYQAYLDGGPRKISPFFVPSSIINMVSGNLSIMYGLKGPNYSIVSACSSGAHSIAEAAMMIRHGRTDVMIAGGAEMATSPVGLGGFAAARALSRRNDDPQGASRPWDKDRDGFVLSDGAGVVVLEEYEQAKARGAKIYAELAGIGMNSDAYHMTAPSVDGSGAAKCMELALQDGGINVDEVDYINAHGTSTPAGDVAETMAVKRAFGDHAYKLCVSSTKSMTGHMLGAAGGAEAVYTILALYNQVVPPTINLENQDPECDLDYVPNSARAMKLDVVISNSFGFGGTNGTLAFRRVN